MTHVLDALGRIKEYWGSVALADLDDYAQGRIIRGGAADWEAYAAETLGAVLIGDGTDVISDTTPTFVGVTTHNAGIAVAAGQSIVMGDGAQIGQAAGPLIEFDDTGDDLKITGCDVLIDPGGALAAGDGTLHVHTATAGGVIAHANANDLVVENNAHTGISILSPDGNDSAIYFGSPSNNVFGQVKARFGVGLMTIGTANAGFSLAFQTGASALAVYIDANGHTYPAGNKTQDLGLAGNRWREIFSSLALNTGTSRLVPVRKNCAVDGTQLVRSTGGLRVTGEESDFLLAFCPICGTVAMEELKHRIAPAVKSAPEIVLTGIEVLKSSGNTKSVVINFRYGDDVEDEETGTIQKGAHNSTTLSDDELVAFLGMTDGERKAFLLSLGQIEWDALEKMEVIQPELETEQVQINSLIRDLVGKDLLKEMVN